MNKATIQWYGHASVLITSESGKKIFIDPWLEQNPACPDELKNIEHVDYICLTHGHGDHAGSAVSLAKRTGATVFAVYELALLLISEGVPEHQVQPMGKGGTVKAPFGNGITVSLTHAFHSSSYQCADGTVRYAGEACGIVVQLESGRKIYHSGDTEVFSDMELIGNMHSPEVALLPIGDRYTMGPVAACEAATLLQPRYVIPLHYATFDFLPGRLSEFEELMAESEIKVIGLKPGEEFSF